jgi:hypothetical protein
LAADPLTYAYTSIFTETDDGLRVLRDLIAHTGFMSSLPIGTDPAVLADHNARRAVFGRIYEILMTSHAGQRALAEAFRPAENTEENT